MAQEVHSNLVHLKMNRSGFILQGEPYWVHLALCNLLAVRNSRHSTVGESFCVVKDKEKPPSAVLRWDKNGTEVPEGVAICLTLA